MQLLSITLSYAKVYKVKTRRAVEEGKCVLMCLSGCKVKMAQNLRVKQQAIKRKVDGDRECQECVQLTFSVHICSDTIAANIRNV